MTTCILSILRFILFYSVVLYFIKWFYIAELHVTWFLFNLKSVSQKTLYGEWHRIYPFIWHYFCLHWIISIYLNVSCWKVILTCILYNSISYIYIYTCLLENESGSKHVFKTPVRHLNSSSVFLTAPAPANELFCLWDEKFLLRKIRN